MLTNYTRVERKFKYLVAHQKYKSEHVLKTEGGKEIFYRNASDSRKLLLT